MSGDICCPGVRLAMFFHGIAGDENTLSGLPLILEELVDCGFVVVEARGCKEPSPSQDYTGDFACIMAQYRAAFDEANARYCLRGETHIIGNS